MRKKGDSDRVTGGGRSSARIQHTVPQLLLNSFAQVGKGKKKQISVFDKHEERTFTAAVDKVFGERDFNTYTSEEGVICLEEGLGRIETAVAPILKKIQEQRRIVLSESELGILSLFVAILHTRTGAYRRHIQETAAHVRSVVAGNFENNEEALAEIDRSLKPEIVKLQALGFMANSAAKIAAFIINKKHVLFAAREGTFLIGDMPVVLYNDKQFGPYGNIGFAVPGIQIYIPLNKTLTLSFLCPTIIGDWELKAEEFEQKKRQVAAFAVAGAPDLAKRASASLPEFEEAATRSRKVLEDLRLGNPIDCNRDNVTFLNSLQVGFAERYIAFGDGDFSLVRRMIKDREEFRRGRKLSIN